MTNIMSERARQMRREKTQAEKKLWRELRELNRQGFHFRQQAPIGPFIADFADHTAKIVIEVDGGQHAEPKGLKTDQERTRWLEANGYRVLRFWNNDVLTNTLSVMDTVVRDVGLHASDKKEAAR
ncbi:endonuclease domain-containing protein [Hyphomicrobium sp. CS1GBMeth3]|uniref:endonuclease domain-containing protein n=1 Tax=Hyphomicrobium sp. CS1GBMeth3 TaxID=1892845 RepID=UPI000930C7FB|nr:endonuclease domain-containing protein [Hyphomicrobium sp. CS1GBMeth3]